MRGCYNGGPKCESNLGERQCAEWNPFFSNFALYQTAGVSWYNALQINVTKKVGHGLEFQSAYTYSKLLDDTRGFQIQIQVAAKRD